MKLNNIILDLGGVLIDIDFNKVQQAFHRLGFSDFDLQYSQFQASHLFQDLEMGKISETDFYKTLKKLSSQQLNNEQLKSAWNSILDDFRIDSMNFLQTIKKKYRIFLLSNTNSIHLREINKILNHQFGVGELDYYFEKAYYSQKIGMRKPNTDVYQYVIQDAQLIPEETLFIDDTYINIDAAKNLGFQTHLLIEGEQIENLIYFK
jgi:putative hydrolase of the HAD superfamily